MADAVGSYGEPPGREFTPRPVAAGQFGSSRKTIDGDYQRVE